MKHARPDYDRIQDPEGRIPEKEPVFLLRAQDRTAAATLRFWIVQNQALPDGDATAIRLAKKHLAKMEAWPRKKTADVLSKKETAREKKLKKLERNFWSKSQRRLARLNSRKTLSPQQQIKGWSELSFLVQKYRREKSKLENQNIVGRGINSGAHLGRSKEIRDAVDLRQMLLWLREAELKLNKIARKQRSQDR